MQINRGRSIQIFNNWSPDKSVKKHEKTVLSAEGVSKIDVAETSMSQAEEQK